MESSLMDRKPTATAGEQDPVSALLEYSPLPMALAEGPTHILRYANPAFCRLIDKASDQLVGRSFGEILPDNRLFLEALNRIYRTGKAESRALQDDADARPPLSLYAMWPVLADNGTLAIVVQAIGIVPRDDKMLAMNEALMLGSLRQHELTAAADSLNVQLQAEIVERKQREHDALMLTNEVAHRVGNNLQIVLGLIAEKARRTPAPYVQGYKALQSRIGAIAELYGLMSRSGNGEIVAVDAYLRQIAESLSASLLEDTSGIEIEVRAEALDIDPDRAVPLGLLVNELTTNAIKHAFPKGTGRVVLSVEQVGGQMELTVADNGVGMKNHSSTKTSEKHGADYVAIFVRQLGGTMVVSGSKGTGTTIRIQVPLRGIPPGQPSV